MYKDFIEQYFGENLELNYRLIDNSLPGLDVDNGDVGYDLYVRSIDKEFRGGQDWDKVHLEPGDDIYLNMNVAVEAPQGFFFDLRSRSSAYDTHGIKLTNSLGTIDPSYSGSEEEIVAHVHNTTQEVQTIERGDRPFQLICIPYVTPIPQQQEELEGEARGGYGTTGQGVDDSE